MAHTPAATAAANEAAMGSASALLGMRYSGPSDWWTLGGEEGLLPPAEEEHMSREENREDEDERA